MSHHHCSSMHVVDSFANWSSDARLATQKVFEHWSHFRIMTWWCVPINSKSLNFHGETSNLRPQSIPGAQRQKWTKYLADRNKMISLSASVQMKKPLAVQRSLHSRGNRHHYTLFFNFVALFFRGNIPLYTIHLLYTNSVVYKYIVVPWVLPWLCDARQLLPHWVRVDVCIPSLQVGDLTSSAVSLYFSPIGEKKCSSSDLTGT